MSQERLLNILLKRHSTEKTVRAEADNTYTFLVAPDASKAEVKSAIEHFYNVRVKKVRTLNQKPKQRVFRGRKGVISGFKKAYVILNAGHFIDFNKPINVVSEK